MKQLKPVSLWLFSILMLLFVTGCNAATDVAAQELNGLDHNEANDHDDDGHADDMGMAHAHVEPPAEYVSLTNPLADDHDAVESGAELYATYCAVCHGAEGNGDGPGAAALDPQPARLSDGMMMTELSDGYLYWRVTEGGQLEPFNSAMPAWETALTEEQRWQVISYVRGLADESDVHANDNDRSSLDGHDNGGHMNDQAEDNNHMGDTTHMENNGHMNGN